MQKLIKTYQDLIVWQRSMDLAVECYNMTASFPKNELYGLVSQINRSCASIPANIAGRTWAWVEKGVCPVFMDCSWLAM